jgi:hypothetical protein
LRQRWGDRAARSNERKETAMALWARAESAEREYEAAAARFEPFEYVDPGNPSLEYEEAENGKRAAWLHAEGARHDLEAFVNPRRCYTKGYDGKTYRKFSRRAKAAESKAREKAPAGDTRAVPRTRVPLAKGNPDGHKTLITGGPVVRLREGLENPPTVPAPTPYQLGLAPKGVSWADLNMHEPVPSDPDECGWIWWEWPREMPDREPDM